MSANSVKYFFSYAREDSEFTLELAKHLRAVGIDLWVDQLDILAGEHWDRAIEEALKTCQGMIAILSPEAVASDNMMDEVSYALEEGKLVVPILLRPCSIPFRLRRVQRIDFTTNFDTGFSNLVRALHIEPARISAGNAVAVEQTTARPEELPLVSSKQQAVRTAPQKSAKQARWPWAVSISFVVLVWVSVLAAFLQISSIIVTGPLLSITGILVAVVGSRSGTRLLNWLMGLSAPAVSVFCVLLINFKNMSPREAEAVIPPIGLVLGVFVSIVGGFQIKQLGSKKPER